MKKDTRKHRFVVGFNGDNQCIYGKGTGANNIVAMTLFDARQNVKRLSKSRRGTRNIYEIVPIETID